MTIDWTTKQLSAYNKIKTKGFSVSVVRPGNEGVWDDDAGVYVGGTPDATYLTYSIKSYRNIVDAQGTVIQTDAAVLLIPAYGLPEDLKLDAKDEIQIDGVNQNVIKVTPVDPGNIPIMYEVFIG